MEKLTLNVEGMTCSHCEARVTKALSEVNGVKSAVVSLDEGTATVEFEKGQVTEDALIDAVEEAGYEVAEFKSEKGDSVQNPPFLCSMKKRYQNEWKTGKINELNKMCYY